ncbi:MAG: ATP-dependent RNA helicase HrpA [Gammaproteobacteria bacterium]|nr:ATP-dependent RNA helicase HrpA [Gammaproteobacteria bacterium]
MRAHSMTKPVSPVEAALKLLAQEIEQCALAERAGLKRRWHAARARLKSGKPADRLLADLERDIARSRAWVEARRAKPLRLVYPEELPVSQRREEILKALAQHQVVILAGETGSGKTTQLPKLCLELGRGLFGQIGHTQPRRLAARAVADRIAEELATPLGEAVGFKVRFSDKVSESTRVKLMTDGILLAEIQGDPLLSRYDTLIIDEAHERSLNIDFLLGYLKQLLPRRPDLKLIITSATIDLERFSAHFGDAPIVEVSGRTYPVEVLYRPLLAEDEDGVDRDLEQAILDAVDELARIGMGDVLVFLPGEREIRATAEALRKHHPPHTEILPLYARLSAAEQHRIFQGHAGRRIVLATNVAETSLTVPGIRYVVDTGLARISRYSIATKVQRLPIEKIAQASANQRKGRCGRVAEGVCIRLYEEKDYELRPAFTDPEILRTNLAAVILQMLALGLGDIEAFPFLEPPDGRAINDGLRLLEELGAITRQRELTAIGRQLARLPVDPRLARLLVAAQGLGCLKEVLIIASALAIQDVRERPGEFQQAADEKHRRFVVPDSDFLSILKLWEHVEGLRATLSENKLRKTCRDEFLSYVRVREWRDLHHQLAQEVKDMGWRLNDKPAEYEGLHRALLSGFLGQIGYKTADGDYLGARNIRFHIFPASGLFRKGPKWLMAAELAETSRLYARLCARIEPEWVEAAAGELVRRQYFEPHWEQRRAQVAAYEQVSLYGLPLVEKRKLNYGPIDPVLGRELFIRHALVLGEYEHRAPFWKHNQSLISDVEDLEHKARRRDVLVDEDTLFAYYDSRLPEGIYSGPQFEQWLKQASADNPRVLQISLDELMQREAGEVTEERYPEYWRAGELRLPLAYQFEPGHEDDGVTVSLPLTLLNQLEGRDFAWSVPGFRQDLLAALLKSLPKHWRKNFVPAPDFASALLQSIKPADGPLLETMGTRLFRMTGVNVPLEAWDWAAVPEHLRMNFRITGERGKLLAQGRDLEVLKAKLSGKVEAVVRESGETLEREGLVDWSCGSLPAIYETRRAGLPLRAFPALVDQGASAALRLFDVEAKARLAHRAGLRRLVFLHCSREYKYLEKQLPGLNRLAQYFQPVGTRADLLNDLVMAQIDRFLDGAWEVRSAEAFAAMVERVRAALVAGATEQGQGLDAMLKAWHELWQQVAMKAAGKGSAAHEDMAAQLRGLVFPGFLAQVGAEQLRHYPRYCKALTMRLDKLKANPGRDAEAMAQLKPWLAKLAEQTAKTPLNEWPEAVREIRWLLEEWRVALFAQGLKTAVPVSAQRVQKRWDEWVKS